MALIFCSMQVKNRPFLLSPAAKDYIWGGTRLREEYNKHIDVTPLAETWECSTHPDGPSRVASGAFAGEKLVDVLRAHPEFIGTHPKTDGEGGLPVLIKFIDAARDLSVQVHPSDEYARTHEHGQLGKPRCGMCLKRRRGRASSMASARTSRGQCWRLHSRTTRWSGISRRWKSIVAMSS